jgi:hypothetical protein
VAAISSTSRLRYTDTGWWFIWGLYPRIILAEVKPDLVKHGIRVCKEC